MNLIYLKHIYNFLFILIHVNILLSPGMVYNICLQVFHLVLILYLLIFNVNYHNYFMICHSQLHILITYLLVQNHGMNI